MTSLLEKKLQDTDLHFGDAADLLQPSRKESELIPKVENKILCGRAFRILPAAQYSGYL